jgi:hypothetical protein
MQHLMQTITNSKHARPASGIEQAALMAGPINGRGAKTTASGNLPEAIKGKARDSEAAVGKRGGKGSGKLPEPIKGCAADKAVKGRPGKYSRRYRLRFGRFLNFTTTVVNSENLPPGSAAHRGELQL